MPILIVRVRDENQLTLLRLEDLERAVERIEQNTSERVGSAPKRVEVTGIRIKCPRCGHEWTYRGSMMYATCPKCRTKIPVSRHTVGE